MLEKFEWKCPRAECERNPPIFSYSKDGLQALVNVHNMEHEFTRRRHIKEFDEALAKAKVEKPKDYNKLPINVIDIGFLKTRGIKVDDDMELTSDGYGSQYTYPTRYGRSVPTGHLGKPVQPDRDEYGTLY